MRGPNTFHYHPSHHELESASNSYLMSLIAIIAGMPLPILNLIASVAFYFGNRNSTHFVRWHCTQALLSQLCVFFVNCIAFWWTISIIFFDDEMTENYIIYIVAAIIFNLIEFIATISTAIDVRKGKHVKWPVLGTLTDDICKP
jgi:uncharacterized membrane protein